MTDAFNNIQCPFLKYIIAEKLEIKSFVNKFTFIVNNEKRK